MIEETEKTDKRRNENWGKEKTKLTKRKERARRAVSYKKDTKLEQKKRRDIVRKSCK